MQYAFENLQDIPMRVNRMNVDAMTLLSEHQGFEAVSLLRKALALDAMNPFTLNNLGVADESIGDYSGALASYTSAAAIHSAKRVAITQDRTWRGRSVSVMAAASARRLVDRMKKMDITERNAAMLTLRGVSATNRNEWLVARQDFLDAYSLDPFSAFSLNNRGFVAEMDGDLETAQDFYEKARQASGSDDRIGLATQLLSEGKKLSSIAATNNLEVNRELEIYSQKRHQETGPIELTPRGNVPGDSSAPMTKPTSKDIPPLR